jgi:tetratricopeptide (TPR) repeat protein
MTARSQDEAVGRGGGQNYADEERLVPVWLAVAVLFLLVAVVAVGGFIVRGLMENRSNAPEQIAISTWEKAVAADPSDPNARLQLAYAYQRDRQFDKALDLYRQVLASDPKETAALYNMGAIYLELGLGKQAEVSLWKVLEIDPAHALAAKALGDYYASKGHYKSVVRAVRPVVQAQPSLADLQYLMGLSYERLGHPDWAKARYDLALKYAPDLKEARDGLRRLNAASQTSNGSSTTTGSTP